MKDSIKVMLIAPYPPPSGGEATWAYKYLEFCKEHNRKVYHVNTSLIGKRARNNDETINIIDEIRRCFYIWRGIIDGIKTFHPDIIHMDTNCYLRSLLRDYISTRIIRIFGAYYLIHCRCSVKDQIRDNALAIVLFKAVAQNAKTILVQNYIAMNYVERITGISAELMPNYIERSYVAESKQISDVIEKVMYFGHVKRSKGIDELTEVAKQNPSMTFLIAGPITEDYKKQELEKRSKNIILLGVKTSEEIKHLLDSIDVFLFPTHSEGFSNSLLEAMSRGVPVITTRVGANEMMLEGRGGILVDSGDVDGMLAAMKSIESKMVRESMSKFNIDKVRNNYTIEKVMKRIFSLYSCILQREQFE